FEEHEITLPTRELLRAIVHDAMSLTVPMVFLKQFTDVTDGNKAVYQAVVEADNKVMGGFKGGGLLPGNWIVSIRSYDSCRIVEQLGLRVSGHGPDGAA